MSSQRSNQSEPSMEEILSSIQRIMAADAEGSRAPQPAEDEREPVLGSGAVEDDEGDVLLLTEMVAEDGTVVSLAAAGEAPAEAALPVSDGRREPVLDRAEEPAMAEPDKADQPLLSEERAAASAALLRELARTVSRGGETATLNLTDPALEGVVRESLRSLLREWLDAHLPPMVERLVREEIQRVVARAGRDA